MGIKLYKTNSDAVYNIDNPANVLVPTGAGGFVLGNYSDDIEPGEEFTLNTDENTELLVANSQLYSYVDEFGGKFSGSTSALNSHVALAYSEDGTDGFFTVYPNLNLLVGTKDFSGTWNNSTLWTDDGTYNGLKVRKRTAAQRGTYKVWTVPTDGTYTFSCYIKSSGANAAVHGAFIVNGVREPDRIFGNDFDWKRDSLTRTLKAGDSIIYSYEMAGSAVGSTIWVSGYKIESGSTATPWASSLSEFKATDFPQLNLLSNSKFPGNKLTSPWGSYANGGTVVISNGEYNYTTPSTGTGSGQQGGLYYSDTSIMTTQKSYVLSMKVKGSGTIRVTYQYTYTDGTTSSWIQGGDTTLTDSYGLAITIIAPQTKAFTKVSLALYFQGTSTGSIKEPKLEEGSTATPYMPSTSEVTIADWPSYIGQYSDNNPTGSNNPYDYNWSSINGNKLIIPFFVAERKLEVDGYSYRCIKAHKSWAMINNMGVELL